MLTLPKRGLKGRMLTPSLHLNRGTQKSLASDCLRKQRLLNLMIVHSLELLDQPISEEEKSSFLGSAKILMEDLLEDLARCPIWYQPMLL